ncbi:MAG: dephospho-CoA kinase [Rhodobiaceae bacterium]|nr:dephospho-CoA kinase [Rhodobiaceae bacterium]|tara:strand:- start:85608 stop:86192 length:585 start_codon:yes stop_codon:yes gene_type:complete
MIKVALTGGIGVGKSFVLNILKDKYNFPIFSSDDCVRSLYLNEPSLISFVKSEIMSNEDKFSKSRIAEIVFNDQKKLRKLESFIHPLVKIEREKFIDQERRKEAKTIIVEIPLLFEKNLTDQVDIVILVRASDELQKKRVLKRPNMNEVLFNKIIKNQMDVYKKEKKSDYIIDSNDYASTVLQIENIVVNMEKK